MSVSTLPLFADLELVASPPELAPRRAAPRRRRAAEASEWQIMLEPQPAPQVAKPEVDPSTPALEVIPGLQDPVAATPIPPPVELDPAPLRRPEPLTNRPNVTLADVMDYVGRDPSITSVQCADRLCAVRRLGKALDTDPRLIPATPDNLRKALKAVVPSAVGLSDRRFETIRSRTLTAMRQAGIRVMRGRSSTVLSTGWQPLAKILPDAGARNGLSRFMRFCTDLDIAPQEVDDGVFDRFRVALEQQSLVRSPHVVLRTACDQWNKAVRRLPDWPRTLVKVPRNPRHYALEWSDFPKSFVADVEAFFASASKDKGDLYSDDHVRRRRPATIALQRAQIRQMASHLVATGMSIECITSLKVLVKPAHAETLLRAAHKRLNPGLKEGTVHLQSMANLLRVVAKYWVKAELQDVEKLADLTRRSAPPPRRGMTIKNRGRLRQFDNREHVLALLELPERVFRELKAIEQPSRLDALRAQHAQAIAILLGAPLRISNVAGLDLNRHLIKIGRGSNSPVHIAIPEQETKNSEPFEVVLAPETVALLNVYRTRYRPLISDVPSTLLFPNQKGGQRDTIAFSAAISDFLRRETGLVMNVHLFRHLVGKLYLDARPDDLETVRRILGHKSIVTTQRYYAELKQVIAFARYDEVIRSLRARPLMPGQSRPTGKGGR